MSNRRYYARRAVGLCPDCGIAVASGVYCVTHRAVRRQRVIQDRAFDREGYNQYMRVYKQQRKPSPLAGQEREMKHDEETTRASRADKPEEGAGSRPLTRIE